MFSKFLCKDLKSFFFKPISNFSTQNIYGMYLQKKVFTNREMIIDYILKQDNKKTLLELIKLIKEEHSEKFLLEQFNTAYQLKDISCPQILIDVNLLDKIPPANSNFIPQSFIQKQFIQSVNSYFNQIGEDKQLRLAGICEELVFLWYFIRVFLNKDFLEKCNTIQEKLVQGKNLTPDEKKIVDLVLQLQGVGKQTLVLENFHLSSVSSIEAHLWTCVRHRFTIYLPKITSFNEAPKWVTDCKEFSEKVISRLKSNSGQLEVIRVGSLEKNLMERSHVLGCSSFESNNETQFHLFDPNSGSHVVHSALDAENILTSYLIESINKFNELIPSGSFFLRSGVPFTVKNTIPEYPKSFTL